MRRPAGHVRSGVAGRLAEQERRNPEWRAWLALLREIAASLDEAARATAYVDLRAGPGVAASAVSAPLLHQRTLRADLGALTALLTRLLRAAGRGAPVESAARSLGRYRPDREAARALLEAAIGYDDHVIAATAETEGLDPGALGNVAHLASVPVLAAVARNLARQISSSWAHGYCPVCGGWPVLAELLGVERQRSLRCARCGAGWRAVGLRCPYCGEATHERLGALATADELESRKVETCATCRHYLKAMAALVPQGHMELLLADLETVELDLAARERGYRRPPEPGYRVVCPVVPA